MNRSFLALTCLALFLLLALMLGVSLGEAQTAAPLHSPRPSPTPDGLGPAISLPSPDIPLMPDLVVTAIEVLPSQPLINEEVTIRVTIKNQGPVDVPLGNNFYTDLYIDPSVLPIQLFQDGDYAWGCQAYWLPAGASYVLAWTHIFTDVKVYSLWAQVDTDSQVAEADENNNVLGPVHVQVVAPRVLVYQTHQDFQMGLASGLDISHPEGVIRQGIFLEPFTEPEVYTPDRQVDDPPLPPAHPNNVNQVKPALTSNGHGTLYAVWEDGRNGGVFNRDIYFSRSTDGGLTWSTPDVRVNWDDPITHTVNQLSPDIIYDDSRGRLYVAWQDGRDGDFNIYFAYSDDQGDTWSPNVRLNDDVGSANQMNPALAIGAPPGDIWNSSIDWCDPPATLTPIFNCQGKKCVYVVWQDQRNGNDDIYLARSQDGGATWGPNYFVTDDPSMTWQNQVAPTIGVDNYFGHVHVGWEDWRDPLHPEIYVMRSFDGGQTFGIDVPVTIVPPDQRSTYRIEPSLEMTSSLETVYVWCLDPFTGLPYICDVYITPISVVHIAWQDGESDDADIYYSYTTFDWCEPEQCPYPYEFCFTDPQEVSGFVMDSEYVRPPDEVTGTWLIDPTWQGQVTLDLVPDEQYFTLCHADSTTVYSKGVVIAWSDDRSFDDWRAEIRTRRIASPSGDPKMYEVCEDWAEGVVNDNAKLYAYRDDALQPGPPAGEPNEYEIYKPAATSQRNPSLRVDQAGIYVVWDDDRWDDPMQPGTVRNRDVFFGRMALTPVITGIYLSPVIDGGVDDATWYVLSWWGATQHAGDLLMQTRFGSTPYPPREDVAAGTWTRWTGNPSSTYLGCVAGEGCYYDAPGRHIVGPDGADWPQFRYLQYKVIIRGDSRLTALSQVKIYYKGVYTVYLPIVVKKR